MPTWLFEECYSHVGDLAETAALVLGSAQESESSSPEPLAQFIESRLLPLSSQTEVEQKELIQSTWNILSSAEKLVFHKLLTGGLRIGVQRKTVQNALGNLYKIDPAVIAHRMMGKWRPTPEWFRRLRKPVAEKGEPSLPYPFCLAYPVEQPDFASLGEASRWQIEPKWDGIRAQLIRRSGQTFLWSRGEESVGESFPEITESAKHLADGTVLDGEILVWKEKESYPESFGELQKRLGRKKVSQKMVSELPVRFLAYDILEFEHADLREEVTSSRRRLLEEILIQAQGQIHLSPLFPAEDWNEVKSIVQSARERHIEGVMLKDRTSVYRAGRVKRTWWKWKVEPLRIDAVLVYAQAGHGRRSGLFTDYTFSVRDGDQLVPIAKAYSGLSDKEIKELDGWIKKNTREKFGPVRSVPAEKVFELAFDSIRESKRHKAGFALRFPRISRWRRDKLPKDIDTLETVKNLL